MHYNTDVMEATGETGADVLESALLQQHDLE